MGFDDSKDWEELVLVPWKPKPWVVVTLNIFVPGFVAAIFAFALNARAGAIAFLAVVGMNFIGFLHKKEELTLTLRKLCINRPQPCLRESRRAATI
jgi:hypothetical protein